MSPFGGGVTTVDWEGDQCPGVTAPVEAQHGTTGGVPSFTDGKLPLDRLLAERAYPRNAR
jgi:hypothetical protein